MRDLPEGTPHNGPADVAVAARPGPRVAASLMCADLLNMGRDVEKLERAGADLLHLDIMDGNFVPNLALSMELGRQIKKVTRIPLDVHLMVTNPESYQSRIHDMKIDYASFHIESVQAPARLVRTLKAGGTKVGIALNPCTGLDCLPWLIEELDFVLLMTVEPGFAGQLFVKSVLGKIAALRKLMMSHGVEVPIEVDGNINAQTATWCVENGASILVGGSSSVFRPGVDLALAYRDFRREIAGLTCPI